MSLFKFGLAFVGFIFALLPIPVSFLVMFGFIRFDDPPNAVSMVLLFIWLASEPIAFVFLYSAYRLLRKPKQQA